MDIVAISQHAMNQDTQRLATVGQNVANMNTPGYKRQVEGVNSFDSILQSQPINVLTDTKNGKLTPTNSPLDFAILGDGYFEVMTPQGMAYTRAGQFQIDKSGQLQTLSGYAVMGEGGDIVFSNWEQGRKFVVNEQGEITDANSAEIGKSPIIGKLAVVQFPSHPTFTSIGHGLYVTKAAPMQNDKLVRIKQGFVEDSNVEQVENMTVMISAKRSFEDKELTIKNYHQMTQTAINELGEL